MKRTYWKRVIAAAILSEVGVFAALFASFGVYWLATGTTLHTILNSSRGEDISYYVAPPAAFLMTVLAVLWASRPLTSAFVRHGVLIGIVAVVMTFGFIFGARPEHSFMYVVSFGLRIAGGYVGGAIAQRRSAAPAHASRAHAA